MSHILFVQSHPRDRYGVEARERGMAEALIARGHRAEIIGLSRRGGDASHPAAPDSPCQARFFAADDPEAPSAQCTSMALARHIRAQAPDLVVFKGLGYQLVTDTLDALPEGTPRAMIFGGKWRSEQNRRCDLFFVEYPAQAHYLAKTLGKPDDAFIVMPKHIDWDIADRAAMLPKEHDFVSVGAFTARKNHAALKPLFARLSGELIGEGPSRAALQAELPAGSRVRFTGQISREAVLRAMGKARVIAHPSIYEGLPRAAVEAFAVGVPLVGLRSALGDAFGELPFVKLTRPEKFVKAVMRLARRPEDAAALGREARSWARANHGPERMAAVIDTLERWLAQAETG